MKELQQIIDELSQEAAQIQIQGRALRPDEISRVQAIYEALPHLREALVILETKTPSTLITYKIVTDLDGKLKQAARIACNFWNRFIIPSYSVVIRLGTFTSNSNTIARAYKPYERDGVHYGIIEFNTKFLSRYSRNEISGTITHEIGHTLGIGWNEWESLFYKSNGKFKEDAIEIVSDLKDMRVETDYGPGTQFSHWDEQRHGVELMTGFKNSGENVMPVTIDVMALLGHQIAERLPAVTDLSMLLDSLAQIAFSRQAEAKSLNRDHYEETEIWETIPHEKRVKKKK